MKLANFNNNLTSYVDFAMENYTEDTDFITNFVISVLQKCYQDLHTYKCNEYYCSYFHSNVFRLLSFYAKVHNF